MNRPRPALTLALAALLLGGSAAITGCTREGKFQAISMWNESRLKPYEPGVIPGHVSSSLAPVDGTVARGDLAYDDPLRTGLENGKLLTKYPIRMTPQLVERGRERFEVFCAPCHGRLGDGRGMIVKRGFPHPPDYALVRLRQAPIGHFFEVMTHGYGVMYSYASRVNPTDRWAIAAYIRVLQELRPAVTVDPFEAERLRARETGVGVRPVGPETEPLPPSLPGEAGPGGGPAPTAGGSAH